MRLPRLPRIASLKKNRPPSEKVQKPDDYSAVTYTDVERAIMRPSQTIQPHMPDGGWAALLPVLVITGAAFGLLIGSLAWAVLSFGL